MRKKIEVGRGGRGTQLKSQGKTTNTTTKSVLVCHMISLDYE
jgi:hypothetical protein